MMRSTLSLSCVISCLLLILAGTSSGCPKSAPTDSVSSGARDVRKSGEQLAAPSSAPQHAVEAKATGCVSVKIRPKTARQAGARWRVDGGPWKRSGKTVCGLNPGKHTVSFKDVPGWTTPKNRKVTVVVGDVVATKRRYAVAGGPGATETIMLAGNVPLEMVWIQAGTFMMGRYTNEQDSAAGEGPQHQVTLSQGFWMGKYEVTQAQWRAIMGTSPSHFAGDNRPTESVSCDNVHLFIAALNTVTGKTFRLPTESEWEYACRAGTTTRFYWGDDPSYTQVGNYVWYDGNSNSHSYDVGGRLPNPWGLHDMCGNVWEWCQDWYECYPSGPLIDPMGPTSGTYRVVRGGGWSNSDYVCRSAYRAGDKPSSVNNNVGFRLVR